VGSFPAIMADVCPLTIPHYETTPETNAIQWGCPTAHVSLRASRLSTVQSEQCLCV
jgi:hypothetical protein